MALVQGLQHLSPEAREYFLVLVARRFRVCDAIREVYASYPEEHKYSDKAYYDFLHSKGGKEKLAYVKNDVRKLALERGFANKGSRVDALQGVAENVIQRIHGYKKDDRIFVALCSEFRQTMEAIKKEVDPFGTGDMDIESPMDKWLTMMTGRIDTLPEHIRIRLQPEETSESSTFPESHTKN